MCITIPRSMNFEPCIIHHWLDPTGHYDPPMDREFPFFVKLYTFADATNPCPPNWHERLEIFVGVAGDGLFRVGDRVLPFSPGDVLVVDNKKLHRTEKISGRQRRAIVISFMPELVYSLGSPLCDMTYLTPFYCQVPGIDPVVRRGDPRLSEIHHAINRLLRCYAEQPQGPAVRLGCKTYLLELLYHLSQHFAFAEAARSELEQQQQRARRLGKLLEYLRDSYRKKISVADAAGIAGMSESRFMRYFRAATGMTFVSYLTHIRLHNAARLLKDSALTIGEVADACGFSHQSYFDRQFRVEFKMTPREYRAMMRSMSASAGESGESGEVASEATLAQAG
jgi:AraC-like DNA-binding protein